MMWATIQNLISPTEYMPHGNCYLWQTPLIWLHVVSDALIAIAYASIPAMLVYFICKRNDIPFSRVFLLFSAFIIACGTGHLLEIWTLWHPAYWLSGMEKAFTAIVSCYTAFELVTVLPQFLALKTPEELEIVNQQLIAEVKEKEQTEFALKTILEGTSSMTGQQFLPALVTNLAKNLDVKCVFIAEIINQEKSRLRTLAFCQDQQLLDNFEYSLNDSPCQEIIEEEIHISHKDEIQKLFSNNELFNNLDVCSYIGIPLISNANEFIGTMCLLDTKPLSDNENSLAIMKVFASRASAEIERQRATDNLFLSNAKLEYEVQTRTTELRLSLASLKEEINRRKQVETALISEQKQLKKIITNAPVAIAMLDNNMMYIAHSKKWVTDYELSHQNLIEYSFYDTFPDLPDKWIDIPERVLKGESLAENEDIIEYQGKKLYLSWAFQPWLTPKNEIGGLIIVTQNIESLVKAKEIALETAELKSSFLANMSHEIRTPLSGILGIVEILKRTSLSEEQKQYVETLSNSSHHLLFLINDVLDFSKLEAQEMQLDKVEFSLYNCLESVLNVLFTQAENKGLELLTLVEKNVPSLVIGDPNRLKQIMLNLIGNAIKFTEKGQIVIKISFHSRLSNQIQIKFEIIDTGVGIAKEDQEKLFNSFTQVDNSSTRKYGGTGLGLAISKRLVQLKGGEIGVESELGKGSNFWFTANFDESKQQNSLTNLAEEKLNNTNILIIDSSTSKGKIMIQQLEFWGMKCECHSSCLDAVLALQKDRKNKQTFDFVLVNWEENQVDNDKLIYQVLLSHPLLNESKHILILSPQYYNHQLGEWVRENHINYLLKPIHIYQLIEVMLTTFISEEKELLSSKEYLTINGNNQTDNIYKDSLKILLVEDTFINQVVITKSLEYLGYKNVDCAENGKIALEKLEREKYDLIFMDCLMPVLDGYETTKKIRQLEKEENKTPLTIIAMTANVFAGEREKCLQIGMNDYLSKPINMNTLESTLFNWESKIYNNNHSNNNNHNNHSNNSKQISINDLKQLTYEDLIDEEKLIKMFGDDSEKIEQVIDMYVDDAQFYLDDLKNAHKQENCEAICQSVDQLQGISESIGIKIIPSWLSEIEKLTQTSSLENIKPLIDNIEIALEKLTIES